MDIAKDMVLTADNLTTMRFYLMQEFQKLESERDEFETELIEFEIQKDDFKAEQAKFESERKKALAEEQKWKAHADLEKKTLDYQKSLMEKKLAILENGFDELNRDKAMFEREKEEFSEKKANLYRNAPSGRDFYDDAGLLFLGVDNLLALKKRYRDLLKIFHPDNLAGDNEAVQIINEEYALLKESY